MPKGRGEELLRNYANNGYGFIKAAFHEIHPLCMENKTKIISTTPIQKGSTITEYCRRVMFHRRMLAIIRDKVWDLGDEDTQELIINNTDYGNEILHEVNSERYNSNTMFKERYKEGTFLDTLANKYNEVKRSMRQSKVNTLKNS